MDTWGIIRTVAQVGGCLMMIIGATLFGCGLKRDEWKTAVQGLFLTTMGSFGVLITVIANITGR